MAENSGINVQFYQRFTLILLFCFVLALIAFVVLAYYFLNDSTHPLGNRPITSGAVWASICHTHPLQRSTSSRLRRRVYVMVRPLIQQAGVEFLKKKTEVHSITE